MKQQIALAIRELEARLAEVNRQIRALKRGTRFRVIRARRTCANE